MIRVHARNAHKFLVHALIPLTVLSVALLFLTGCSDDDINSLVIESEGSSGPIYIFNSGYMSGNITGGAATRAALDSSVASATVPAVCSGKKVRAFLSLNSVDSIAAMPANLGVPANAPIYGELGPLVANNWGDLLDGTILASMATATGLGTYYFTGSNEDGSESGATCSNWTSTGTTGTIGRGDLTGTGWMNNSAGSCSNQLVLGICY